MATRGPDSSSSFPQWVAWGSLALALVLFFGNTVPAVRERAALLKDEAELRDMRQQYEAALAAALPATPVPGNADFDLQTLLLAIDRIGWTPDELLRHFPEPRAQPTNSAADHPPSRH
ncbi:MAG TPA: hypothetical protein VK348_05620 [Planctomycetota bacterium]|nr:hypothetical protein [Planctomycetota bacterium]